MAENSASDSSGSRTVRGKSDYEFLIPDGPIHEQDEFVRGLLQRLKQLPSVREDLVARMRREIRFGTYETPERIDIAAERLFEDLR